MSFIISTIKFNNSSKYGNFYYSGDVKLSRGLLIIYEGFTYPEDVSIEYITTHYKKEGIDSFKQINGEFSIIICDKYQDKLTIINDHIGRNNVFIFNDNSKFIVSNNFWEVVNIIEPTPDLINENSIKEWLYLFFPLNNKTIINGIEYFPSASIGQLLRAEMIFQKKSYWNFSKTEVPENGQQEDVTEKFYSLINDAVRFIKKKHGEDSVYACSISGGLDSRVIPHFMLKNNMNTISYCISSKKYLRFPFRTRINKIVRKITDHYGIKHYFIDDGKTSLNDKLFLDIKYLPFGYTNINKNVTEDIPNFDIHLNAGGPEMMSTTLTGIAKVNSDIDFAQHVLDKLSIIYYYRSGWLHKFSNLIKYGTFKGERQRTNLLSDEDQNRLLEGLRKYCNFDNYEHNYFTYLYQQIASKTGNGAYENLTGTKTSYSVFFPFASDYLASLSHEYRENRKVLKDLLLHKLPILSTIPSEQDLLGVKYENRKGQQVKKLYKYLMKKVRKDGTPGVQLKSKRNRAKLKEIIQRSNPIFHNIFDKKEIFALEKDEWELYLQCVKVKAICDVIYNKSWKDYVD